MILYHFTKLSRLKTHGSILVDGLKPNVDDDQVWPQVPVVWLTKETADTWSENGSECRITVAIPSTDRRLVPLEKWLRKHGKLDVIAALEAQQSPWRSHYVYLGRIPTPRLRIVDYADPQKRAEHAA